MARSNDMYSDPGLSQFSIVFGIMAEWAKLHQGADIPIAELYRAFEGLKDEFPEILGQFDFEQAGDSVHSRQLEDVLNKMSVWGGIGIANPGYKYIHFQAPAESIEKLFYSKVDDLCRARIAEIARRLSDFRAEPEGN